MTKVGFHEMLSYGHKPSDDDYRENRDALQRAFDEADARDQTYSRSSGSPESQGNRLKWTNSGLY